MNGWAGQVKRLTPWAVAVLALGVTAGAEPESDELKVRVRTEHYLLGGTVAESRLKHYAEALEYIHREYERGFAELFKTQQKEPPRQQAQKRAGRRARDAQTDQPPAKLRADDPQNRFRVVIFGVRQEYEQFGATHLWGGTEFTNGVFSPALDMLLILDQGAYEDTYEVLFHEAFHQFMHRHVPDAPVWLDEGLATHYGYARPTPNGLTFSRPRATYWELIRTLIARGEALPLWDVVAASRREFYSRQQVHVSSRFPAVRRANIYYGEAYTLIHLLLSDEGGVERLREYIRDLALAKPADRAAVTRKHFGPDVCDYLAPHWVRHVNSRPEER